LMGAVARRQAMDCYIFAQTSQSHSTLFANLSASKRTDSVGEDVGPRSYRRPNPKPV